MGTTLRQAFHDIAEAIRAKGVSGKMTPLEMPGKISSLESTVYGTTVQGVLGEVGPDGTLGYP